MKRSKKPLTFAAVAASVGALSLALEGCVYGPPPEETCVYGPPPDLTEETSEETSDTIGTKPGFNDDNNEVGVYGPPPDETFDSNEVDVYGPPPEDMDETEADTTDGPVFDDNMEVVVYGPPGDNG